VSHASVRSPSFLSPELEASPDALANVYLSYASDPSIVPTIDEKSPEGLLRVF
jgi:hypothetical protein